MDVTLLKKIQNPPPHRHHWHHRHHCESIQQIPTSEYQRLTSNIIFIWSRVPTNAARVLYITYSSNLSAPKKTRVDFFLHGEFLHNLCWRILSLNIPLSRVIMQLISLCNVCLLSARIMSYRTSRDKLLLTSIVCTRVHGYDRRASVLANTRYDDIPKTKPTGTSSSRFIFENNVTSTKPTGTSSSRFIFENNVSSTKPTGTSSSRFIFENNVTSTKPTDTSSPRFIFEKNVTSTEPTGTSSSRFIFENNVTSTKHVLWSCMHTLFSFRDTIA